MHILYLFIVVDLIATLLSKVIDMNSKRSNEYKMIGLNISYYRKLKGLTQLQLSEKINISRTHMSNIEAPNMPTSISLETLLDIADALEIPAKNLLFFQNQDTSS